MPRYLLRRLLIVPFLLLGIVTVAFTISRVIPADPLATIVGERQMNNPEVVAAAEERWGLDASIPVQYVRYIGNLLHGDLGDVVPHPERGHLGSLGPAPRHPRTRRRGA